MCEKFSVISAQRLGALAVVCIATLGIGPSAGIEQSVTLVLRGVTTVDLESGELRAGRVILVSADRILAIEADRPDRSFGAAHVVDAQGLYVIPGLRDAHAHLSYWGEDALARLVGHGVTSIRELGGDPDEIAGWKAAIAAGDLIGPAMQWCGPFLEGPEGGDEYRWKVGTPDEARDAAGALLDRGVDFLKIQPMIGRDEVAALVAVAASRDSYVVGHVPNGLSAIDAARLGLRSIEHLSPYLGLSEAEFEETIRVLLERGVWVSPALFSIVAQVEARGESLADSDVVQRAYAAVRRFHAAGVPMLVGANFAYREWPHQPGSALHGEMESLVAAGLTPIEVLRMTTFGNAGFLGVDLGEVRIAAGGRADLLLLGHDPTEDIHNTRSIEGVVLRGRYFDAEQSSDLRTGRRPGS